MFKKKFALILSFGLIFVTSFTTISYAKDSKNNYIINNTSNSVLNNSDISQIKQNINKILSQKYIVAETYSKPDFNDIVNNNKLLELLNKTIDFEVRWYQIVDLKISNYTSTLTINNIKSLKNDDYLINITYDVNATLLPNNIQSSSSGEKYEFEVQKVNGKWCINKMVDLVNDLNDTSTEQKVKNTKISSNNIIQSSDYNNLIESKIDSINSVSANINKYIEEYNDNIKASKDLSSNYVSLASYSGYNASSAVSYALKWALSRNPNYKNYDPNDCTNFVSQCVYAGGIPGSSTWYSRSTAWINVINFYNYMRKTGYTFGGDYSSGSRLGDVIQFYNSSKNTWSHAGIITGTTHGHGWAYSAHSINRKNHAIYFEYPSATYTKLRYIKYWH